MWSFASAPIKQKVGLWRSFGISYFSQVPNEISREIESIERDRSNLRKKYAYSRLAVVPETKEKCW